MPFSHLRSSFDECMWMESVNEYEPPAFPGMIRIDEGHPGEKLLDLVWGLVGGKGFNTADFVIVGSARLFVTGQRTHLSDIDLLARGSTWRQAREEVDSGRGYRENATSEDEVFRLCGGLVEVFDRWLIRETDADHMIDSAEFMGGLPYMSLEELVRYKRFLNRPKDRLDLAKLSYSGHNGVLIALENPGRALVLGRWRPSRALWRKPWHVPYHRIPMPRSTRSGGSLIIPGR
jgi:hypothetical protein